MQIIQAGLQDAARLALLNKRLIEDEQSDNPMSVAELEGRMRGFLRGEYHAYLFSEGGETVGYALIRHTALADHRRLYALCLGGLDHDVRGLPDHRGHPVPRPAPRLAAHRGVRADRRDGPLWPPGQHPAALEARGEPPGLPENHRDLPEDAA